MRPCTSCSVGPCLRLLKLDRGPRRRVWGVGSWNTVPFHVFLNLDVAMAPREKGTPESTPASPIFNIAVTSVDGRLIEKHNSRRRYSWRAM